MSDLEEAMRLAEIGEYLYNRSYSYGNGYDEPREFGIEWEWQQSKPNEFGQGVLLAEAVKWHSDMAEDGIVTEATKLRSSIEKSIKTLEHWRHEVGKLHSQIDRLKTENERFRKSLLEINTEAENTYISSLRKFEATECLGWAEKVMTGKFGEDEHEAHKQANVLMGRSQGLWAALKIARDALEGKP